MSNAPNLIQVIFRNIFGQGKSSALTSRNNEVTLKLVKMNILEMEDVLFHLNSAIMMPENPQGKSSKQGAMASNDESLDVTGLKALALVFKQFEFDPDVRMIISGHTDTSGTAEFNFKLSDERAKNILSWPIFPDLSEALLSKKLRINKLLEISIPHWCD